MNERKNELVGLLAQECASMEDIQSLLKELFKGTIEQILEAEMDEHFMLRKFTKTKTTFPSDDSLKKSIYLSIDEIYKKWSIPVANWGIIMGQLLIFFDDRLSKKAGA